MLDPTHRTIAIRRLLVSVVLWCSLCVLPGAVASASATTQVASTSTLQKRLAVTSRRRAVACRRRATSRCASLRRQERGLKAQLRSRGLAHPVASATAARVPQPSAAAVPGRTATGAGAPAASGVRAAGAAIAASAAPPAAVPVPASVPAASAPPAPLPGGDASPGLDPSGSSLASVAAVAGQPAPTLHVAATGSDTASGDADHPLASLGKALARATGGERIVVAPGSYPAATDYRARSTRVEVVGPGGGRARVAGLAITGGQQLDVSGLTFTAGVSMRSMWTPATGTQDAAHIDLHDDEFTSPGSTCISAKDGSSDIAVRASVVHDCLVGFGAGAGGTIAQSSGLTIDGNRFSALTGDGIQFGQWNDVAITGNTIDGIRDPAAVYHNDGIQLTGNSERVLIAGNRILNSRTQLIFIQDAVGPIDDVLVENNLVLNAGAVAVQSLGATHVRFANDTIWGGKDGGLWLGAGSARTGHAASSATDTVVANTVTQDLVRRDGAATGSAAGNVVPCRTGQAPGTDPATGTSCVADMAFVNAAAGDFHLRPDAAARTLGAVVTPAVDSDLDGLRRPTAPVPGAFR